MLENIQAYLSKQGVKYIKPEKAGLHQEEMEDLKALAQSARKEMQVLSKALEERLTPFKMDR
ncbi:MAG: HI_0552 family protein, partial [Streptococcus salivarius]